jgi:creatinine amidohydrolase
MCSVILPSLPLGVTEFGREFVGALSISPLALVQVIVGVAQGLKRDGACALVLVNAHLEPAQLEALHQAVGQVTAHVRLPCVFPDMTQRNIARTLSAEFRSGACHAGQFETSLVLAEEPGLNTAPPSLL